MLDINIKQKGMKKKLAIAAVMMSTKLTEAQIYFVMGGSMAGSSALGLYVMGNHPFVATFLFLNAAIMFWLGVSE